MSYIIEPMPVIQFINDSKMKLPRFQRKKTWDNKQRFELCVSVFQDYPVGVVIVNKEKNISWLLDGRQRRETLVTMHNNPVELYEWAKSYIGFNKNATTTEIIDKYWKKIDKYLQKEELSVKPDKSEETDDSYGGEEESEEYSFNSQKQKEGLETLLNMVLMVHSIDKKNISQWERTFDFKDYLGRQPYSLSRTNNEVVPTKLKSFLTELSKKIDNNEVELNEDAFFTYMDDCGITNAGKENEFKQAIHNKWDLIEKSIITIGKFEKVLEDARIGIIHLMNVSDLDAQNIFSRVNKGGTLLKAEELLSAKPFWNYTVNCSNAQTITLVKELYKQLEVEEPKDIVRWDIAATVIQRIKDSNLLFSHNELGKIDMTEVTLGFKVLSSIYCEGMSNKSVIELENYKSINWDYDIDTLIDDINKLCQILNNDTFFKYLQSWNKPMTKLLGNAITLEFLAIMLKDWKEGHGSPVVAGNDLKTVQRDARILFDRLVFEYATKVWRGSGDSKMSKDIKAWSQRLKPIDDSEWKRLITDACGGSYNGEPVTQKTMTPILYYYYVLKDLSPMTSINTTYDVDHLIPQEKFKGNPMVNQNMMDSLINLSLLPKRDNISKSSKALNEITDTWLKGEITVYTGVQQGDFDKFSNIANLDSLKAFRQSDFENVFAANRMAKLSN